MADENAPPPFQIVGTAKGFLTDTEMDQLIAEHTPLLTEGMLGAGQKAAHIRRSQVVFLGMEDRYRWLYERIWEVAQESNRLGFGVDIAGVEPNIQFTRYDGSDQGFYDWHTDFLGLPASAEDLDLDSAVAAGGLRRRRARAVLQQPTAESREGARHVARVSELRAASRGARDARHALQPGCVDPR